MKFKKIIHCKAKNINGEGVKLAERVSFCGDVFLQSVICILLSMGLFMSASAGEVEIYVEPKLIFTAVGQGFAYPVSHSDSASEAFEKAKPLYEHCEMTMVGEVCYKAVNFRPSSTATINGVPRDYRSDSQQCSPKGCVISESDPIRVNGGPVCPKDPVVVAGNQPQIFVLQGIQEGNNVRAICRASVSDIIPCNDCDGRGNPIHPGTGQKFQIEPDYVAAQGGLRFVRTYRNTTGFFTSPANQAWIDNSAVRSWLPSCLPSFYPGRTVDEIHAHCFQYTTSFAGSQTYHLRSSNGRLSVLEGTDPLVSKVDRDITVTRRTGAGGAYEWWLRDARQGFAIYSALGAMLRQVSMDGRHDIKYSYSDAATPTSSAFRPGLLIEMADRSGRTLKFSWNALSFLKEMQDPQGGLYAYGYDRSGHLISVTYPDAAVRSYSYEPSKVNGGSHCTTPTGSRVSIANALTGIDDENGRRFASFQYDCLGRAYSTEHAGGVNKFTLSYAGGITTVTDPLGAVRTHSYSNILSVMRSTGVSQSSPSGTGSSSMLIAYDSKGKPSSRNDFNGNRTCYLNEAARSLETVRVDGLASSSDCSTYVGALSVLPSGVRKTSTEWHPDWAVETRLATPGQIIVNVYNGQPDPFNGNAIANCAPVAALLPDGKPIVVLCKQVQQATTDVNGAQGFGAALEPNVPARQRNWTYNQHGQVLTEDGPRTDVADITTYEYYTDTTADHMPDDLKQVTNAAGTVTQYTKYNKHGQVLESVDANNVLTVNTYDLRQRLLSSSVGGQTTGYSYDPVGQLKRITLPDTSWIGYDYDDAHRQVAVYDHKGNRISYTLDNAGNRTGEDVKDPGGVLKRQLTRTIDALGRVQQTKAGV